ncbi:hypothetical protein EWM64_g6168 [Hericium alpestre]|uniref:Uncharacterized protein n=1 Tax=Hericium alpestre TaxID=135208 RepID=A0A4Y9ZUW5_9AGAM|nr:hypothetical protein EWM64_g6168 [Hericium alpestre]
MLSDPELDLQALEMIWVALHKLMVDTVCGAIEDVVRPAGTFAEDEYLVVLGGKVFRTVSRVPWPFHAWGHAAAVHACYKCLSEYCNSVESHIGLAKYAIIRPDMMRWKRNRRGMFGDSVRRLRYLAMGGFLPLDIHGETAGMKVLSCQACRLKEGDPACAHDSASNASICGVMSLSDPLAQKFADACLRDRNFLTIMRGGAGSQIVSNWEVWTSRTRPSAKLKKWDDAKTNKASEDILGDFDKFVVATPYWDPKGGCFQLYVLDDSGCDVQQFVEKLLVLWGEVHGVDSVEEIVKTRVKTYLDAGELELSKTKVYGSGFLRNVENDFGFSYELLWGIKILPSQMHWLMTRQREILPSQRRWSRAQEQDEEDEEYVAEEDEKLMDSMDPVLCCGGEREEDQKLMKCVRSVLWGTEA